MSASVQGSGTLTVGELMFNLAQIPPEASVKVKTESNQMDGSYWSIEAKWDNGVTQEEFNIRQFDRGPGVRLRPDGVDRGQWGDH